MYLCIPNDYGACICGSHKWSVFLCYATSNEASPLKVHLVIHAKSSMK